MKVRFNVVEFTIYDQYAYFPNPYEGCDIALAIVEVSDPFFDINELNYKFQKPKAFDQEVEGQKVKVTGYASKDKNNSESDLDISAFQVCEIDGKVAQIHD